MGPFAARRLFATDRTPPLSRRKELVRRHSETAALVGFYRRLTVSDGVDALAGGRGHNQSTEVKIKYMS